MVYSADSMDRFVTNVFKDYDHLEWYLDDITAIAYGNTYFDVKPGEKEYYKSMIWLRNTITLLEGAGSYAITKIIDRDPKLFTNAVNALQITYTKAHAARKGRDLTNYKPLGEKLFRKLYFFAHGHKYREALSN